LKRDSIILKFIKLKIGKLASLLKMQHSNEDQIFKLLNWRTNSRWFWSSRSINHYKEDSMPVFFGW